MKLSKSLIALTVVASLALVGCGSSDNAGTNTGNNTSNTGTQTKTPTQTGTQDTANIKAGVDKMLGITADLKKAIDAGDEAKVKATAPQLEDTWGSFEDAVKPKFPDLYEEVEKYLDPTMAGAQVSPLDKATVGQLNDNLIAALNKLNDKVK